MTKDIRFTEKKVDESWKEQTNKDRGRASPQPKPTQVDRNEGKEPAETSEANAVKTSKPFMNLVTSLGVQALMHLGEMPNPQTNQTEVNLEAAKELIDLLTEVKKKTENNLSSEEAQFFHSFLPELQLKYSAQI